MILSSDLILSPKSVVTTLNGADYFIPQTIIRQNYIFGWLNKEILLELYNNALANIHDYSNYNAEQEAEMVKAFFPHMSSEAGFNRFRSICLMPFSVIDRCYKAEFPLNEQYLLCCGLPVHIYRLYLGICYDYITKVDDEGTMLEIMRSEEHMGAVYQQLLSVYIHVALNSPGEIFESYDYEDIEGYLFDNSENMQEMIRNVDRSQSYLQKAAQLIAQCLKGNENNAWVAENSAILLCPLLSNLSNMLLQCKLGVDLERHELLEVLDIPNIRTKINEFDCKLYTEHEGRIYLLCPQVVGAAYLSLSMKDETTTDMYIQSTVEGVHGEVYEDILRHYSHMNYNTIFEDIQTLSITDNKKYQPLDFLEKGYLIRMIGLVFVMRSSINIHPVPVGCLFKNFSTFHVREHIFIPFIGNHLRRLADMDFIVEDGLPYTTRNGIDVIDLKEISRLQLETIKLDINVSQSPLTFRLIQNEFKEKIGKYHGTYIPPTLWDMEGSILKSFEDANYYKILKEDI